MTVLDQIKGLLVDVGVKARDIASNNKFTLVNYVDKKTQVIINIGENKKGINLAALDGKTDKALGESIRRAGKGTFILNDEQEKIINEVSESIKKKSNDEIIQFFSGKIPAEDLVILISSLYIRDKFQRDKSDEVGILRKQLAESYGKKAFVISNLCTASYFEDFLMPLYNEMAKQKDFTIEKFKKSYRKLIDDFPVAIFINAYMTKKGVEEKIRGKIKENKMFSIPYLNIHGIGQENIKNIQKVIIKLKEGVDCTSKKIEQDESIIKVHLRFD